VRREGQGALRTRVNERRGAESGAGDGREGKNEGGTGTSKRILEAGRTDWRSSVNASTSGSFFLITWKGKQT
jgi:hypothetical protein